MLEAAVRSDREKLKMEGKKERNSLQSHEILGATHTGTFRTFVYSGLYLGS